MSAPLNPAEMPSYILERLSRAKEEDRLNPRAFTKFAEELSALVDSKLKDKLYHKLELELQSTQDKPFLEFVQTDDDLSPISIFRDEDGRPFALCRCNPTITELLAQIYFGIDTGQPMPAREGQYTKAEIGLLNLLSRELANVLAQKIETKTSVHTVVRSDFEEDEDTPSDLAMVCSFAIQIGKMSGQVHLALPKDVVQNRLGEATIGEGASLSEIERTAGLSQASVSATIELATKPSLLQRIRDLKAGDCLPLDSPECLTGKFMVRGKELYAGEIGRCGDTYSFKIADVITDQSNHRSSGAAHAPSVQQDV